MVPPVMRHGEERSCSRMPEVNAIQREIATGRAGHGSSRHGGRMHRLRIGGEGHSWLRERCEESVVPRRSGLSAATNISLGRRRGRHRRARRRPGHVRPPGHAARPDAPATADQSGNRVVSGRAGQGHAWLRRAFSATMSTGRRPTPTKSAIPIFWPLPRLRCARAVHRPG